MSRVLFLVLKVWFILITTSRKTYARDLKISELSRRELISDSENFINIDCGAPTNYTDLFGRYFESDTNYVDTGEVSQISSEYEGRYWSQFTRLRSFSRGRKNCYVLRPKQGKNVNYLISAFFVYGNYDGKNNPPTFDLYIGDNYLITIRIGDSARLILEEVILVPTTDTIHVCLVNTKLGVPFISSLQLRPLTDNSIYQSNSASQLIRLAERYDCGSTSTEPPFSRYKDDFYDRIWSNDFTTEGPTTKSQSSFKISANYGEQPPEEVLSTAIQSLNKEIKYNYSNGMPTPELILYLHFAEILESVQGNRNFTITINGVTNNHSSPDYLKANFFYQRISPQQRGLQLSIARISGSQFLPILNALEIFQVIQLSDQLPTDPEDVNALLEIKRIYGVTEDWQGDPCVPTAYSWSRLSCNSDNPPRIITVNLSSSGLTGNITASLSNLKSVRVLDLSYNKLTGFIPESLAELSSLVVLNLAGNKFEGSVPKALLVKSKTGALNLSLDEIPKLCYPDPCKHKKNKALIIAVVTGAILFFGIIISLVCFCKWNGKRVKILSKKLSMKWKPRVARRLKHSEIMQITKDLTSNFLGEGAFGKVYLGQLEKTQVAVKVCSNVSSAHRTEEFENEVQLLTRVHHDNIVSLIGYCNEHGTMALVYEYMSKGNLDEHIKADTRTALTWKRRLQIAVDAARGLQFLHEHKKPKIIHRDLKPTNILLNEDLQAKIADFGISKPLGTKSHATTNCKGTFGYVDPEYDSTRQLNPSSDVYSFGVILLQLITGKRTIIRESPQDDDIHLSRWIAGKSIESIVDPRLQSGTYNFDSIRIVKEIAMDCVKPTKIERPDINSVYSELKDALKIENTLRTEYFTSQTFEMNPMEAENRLMNGPAHTW